jgi:hypothetical protein
MNAGADRITAAKALVEQARKLIAIQEQEVARIGAAGVDPTRAQSLLDAYRESLHLAQHELAEAEKSMEGAEQLAQSVRRIR